MTPKQRGPGQTGNTSWGHRSNRVNSSRRGGNPHAGGGGGGNKGWDCFPTLIVIPGTGALILTGLGAGIAHII